MTYKFKWYNLPNEIKTATEPYSDGLSQGVKDITWYNLPKKLNLLYDELYDIKEANITKPNKFSRYNLPHSLESLWELIEL